MKTSLKNKVLVRIISKTGGISSKSLESLIKHVEKALQTLEASPPAAAQLSADPLQKNGEVEKVTKRISEEEQLRLWKEQAEEKKAKKDREEVKQEQRMKQAQHSDQQARAMLRHSEFYDSDLEG